jgi:Glycosyltransferase family 87
LSAPRRTALAWFAVLAIVASVAYYARIARAMPDFAVYHVASARALAAEPLYRVEDGHYQFKYLPAFAFAMAPFAILDREPAKIVWYALSVILLVFFVVWSVRGLPDRRRLVSTLTWVTVVLMAKFYAHELTLGQSNILLGAVLVRVLLELEANRKPLAGALVGLALFVKPYAVLFVPWLAATSGAAAMVACGIVILAGLLLPAAAYGWSGNLDLLVAWYRTVTVSTAPNLLNPDNVSLASMWAKWLGAGSTATALATVSAAALACIAIAAWMGRGRVAKPAYLEMALLLLLVPLLSPQGWDYVLLLATPAVVCAVDRWREMTGPWRAFTAVALVLMGLTIFDVMGRVLYARFMALSIVSVCAIGLVVVLAHLRRRALA